MLIYIYIYIYLDIRILLKNIFPSIDEFLKSVK